MREARRVLPDETEALSSVRAKRRTPNTSSLRIAGVRPWSDFKEIVLEVVGRALMNGLLVDDILAGIVPRSSV